jgi:hypothetical protein
VKRGPGGSKARVPEYAVAALEALRFDGDERRLRALDDAGINRLLRFADRAQLTLTLNHFCRDALPGWVRSRIDRNISDYTQRFNRLKHSLFEIADLLDRRGIEFTVLKGLAHSPDFTPEALLRVQSDIDIWCSPRDILAARDVVSRLGFVSYRTSEGRHLPPMVREIRWDWRGDYFASDLPIAVELHYELWDGRAECIHGPDSREFWSRRTSASVEGRRLPTLALQDALAFAALHLLMHLLHGDLRLQRAWEIAHFLRWHFSDDTFWLLWRRSHPDSLRRLETIVLQLAADWFGTCLPAVVEDEVRALPKDVRLWIQRYAWSPVEALFRPNKDEIWLHLCLVDQLRDKWSIFLRRVLPLRPPARSRGPRAPAAAELKDDARFAVGRAYHHARALFPTLAGGAKWYWALGRAGGRQ